MRESGTVKFLLNEVEVVLDFHHTSAYTPTTTLLNYLRAQPQLKGTKEGCAEGDCGACTVVWASLDEEGELSFQSIDSCLVFLPMLHGKAVITVEHIGSLNKPHPVQKAMVDCDGSQCGYCTPGFVMSLYALHQNHDNPSKEVVLDALTGNLCRCTGYRSILDAAEQSVSCYPAVSPEQQRATREGLTNLPRYPLAVVGPNQKYFKPLDLDEAVKLRCMYPQAVIISGATDIALKVTKDHQLLEEVIDLSSLEALNQVKQTKSEISIGAGVSLETVKQVTEQKLPALHAALKVFGSLQIRNLATLGGNIGSASPIGDTPPILMAYNAQVELIGPQGRRKLSLHSFITGYRSIALEDNELIARIIIPLPDTTTLIKWYKISKRKDLDISTISGGFRLKLDHKGKISEVALYYGGMAAMTKAASQTEAFLKDKTWTREHIELALPYIDKDFTPISDARAGAEGRRIMARNLLLKFWAETHEYAT